MTQKNNGLFIAIALLPIVVIPFIYHQLIPFPNTKISGNYGMVLSKVEFVIVVVLVTLLGYITSTWLALNPNVLTVFTKPFYIRLIMSSFFTIAALMLLFANCIP